MGLFLLLAFLATPIAEIAVFIEAGDRFGLWPTILAILGTAILGGALLRWQGLSTWARASRSLQRNELPVEELFTGLCLVAAGALLLTPGFITDAIGFALFIPPVRGLIARMVRRRLKARGAIWADGVHMGSNHRDGRGSNHRDGRGSNHRDDFDGSIINGEFHENDPVTDLLPPDDSESRARNTGLGNTGLGNTGAENKGGANSPWRKDKRNDS